MNFDNWYQTIYNNIVLKTKTKIRLRHFGDDGNLEKTTILGGDFKEFEIRNITPEFHMLDMEPNTNLEYIVKQLEIDGISDIGSHRPYVVYATSDKNNAIVNELPKIRKAVHSISPNYVWYYFSHAFISLEWYREYKFYSESDLLKNKTFDYNYISMNRLVSGPRNYRLVLASLLEERKLTNNALLSYSKCDNDTLLIPKQYVDKIKKYCLESKRFDVAGDVIENQSMHININAHLSSFFNVVTETCFYENFNHLTEKVFRPIVMMQPFVLVSTTNNLTYLKSYGFKTFDRWIDESYDKIKNPFKRLEAIVNIIESICSMNKEQQKAMFDEMLPTLLYNRQHFYENLYGIAYKEMWDNFDAITEDATRQQILNNKPINTL